MDKIRLLKKRYLEAKKISDVSKQINALSRTIDGLREKSEGAHKLVQNQASQSQHAHEEIIANANDIDKLRDDEKKAYQRFNELRREFAEVNLELKVKLAKLNQINAKINELKLNAERNRKEYEERTLKLKEQDIEKKLKEKKKITTQDLLVFQRNNNR